MELDLMFLKKTPPNSPDAEKAVLGGILVDNKKYNVVLSIITPEDFYKEAHRKIIARIDALVERGIPVELLALTEELRRYGELEDAGGAAYLASLMDGVPRNLNVEYYARIIKEKALLRRLIFSSAKTISSSYEEREDADEILDQAQASIVGLSDERARQGFVPLSEITGPTMKLVEGLAARKEAVTGVDTGFADLKPYESWYDFTLNIKNAPSIVNFFAAYGTHSTITAEATLAGKRAAALANSRPMSPAPMMPNLIIFIFRKD